ARRQGLAYELSMRKAYADREQANRAKTDFLRNISHELRNPLTGILGFSEAIVHQTGEKSTEKYARLIQNEGEKLLTLINRLLDISKIEAGKFELHPLAFDLKASLSGFAESFRERARLKGLDFRFETDGRIPDYVMGDEAQLLQVLANLTGNAVKFTKKGFVSLSAVVERLTDAGVAVRFEVSDTGIGISRDKQGEIFSAFSQEDPSISREYGGTGLGTTLSRKIVELMGGVIELESEKGRGSRFSFSLDFPLPREDRDQVPAAPVSDAAGMKGKRILVVEDYPVNQKIARMHLEGLGCEVYLAENGLECLRMLREGPYDAVLLDIQMPVMDGLETVRIIRRTEDLAKTLVVAITANAFEEDQLKYREAGMDGVILKPFRRREIQETLSGLFTSQAAGASPPT
ncbi:MAG: response regulator, partial [Spirochaetales bacterium]|nr:response regulator [Spirochaetales bacterium]